MNRDPSRSCHGTQLDGSPCEMPPLIGEDFCFNHHPDKALARDAARRKGGQHRRRHWRPLDTALVNVESVAGLRALLARTIRDTIALDNGVQRSQALAKLIAVGMEMNRETDYEARLAALEARANLSGRAA